MNPVIFSEPHHHQSFGQPLIVHRCRFFLNLRPLSAAAHRQAAAAGAHYFLLPVAHSPLWIDHHSVLAEAAERPVRPAGAADPGRVVVSEAQRAAVPGAAAVLAVPEPVFAAVAAAAFAGPAAAAAALRCRQPEPQFEDSVHRNCPGFRVVVGCREPPDAR